MRLSLTKAAHAATSSDAWQEIRVRSGRDDKFVGLRKAVQRLENHNLPKTNLSSRPERSVVERSAVSFFGSHADSSARTYRKRSDGFLAQIPSRPGGPPAKRQPSPEGLGWNPHHDPERHRRGTHAVLNQSAAWSNQG